MPKIFYMLFRGGTSKGPFFLKKDLPESVIQRDAWLCQIMGSPHSYQVDGIGGGVPNASKVGIVSLSSKPNIDVEYTMAQVYVNECKVDTTGDCGNMLSAVGYFAIESGLISPSENSTTVRVYSNNTQSLKEIEVPIKNDRPLYKGTTHIDGVIGGGASVRVRFIQPEGSQTKGLFPSGLRKEIINGFEASLIDVGRAIVLLNAKDLKLTGYETIAELKYNTDIHDKLEAIRKEAAYKMGISNPTKYFPKIALLSPAVKGGDVSVRYWISPQDQEPHPSLAMTAAMAIASNCLYEGTLASNYAKKRLEKHSNLKEIILEHPEGKVHIEVIGEDGLKPCIHSCSYIRTARLIAKGYVYL